MTGNLAGFIPLAVAAIGGSYGGLVLRARHRRDNLVFGLLAISDALMTAWRGLNVLAGDSISDAAVTVPCAIGTAVLGFLTIEFLAAYPRQPALCWRRRVPLLLWCAFGVGFVAVGAWRHAPFATAEYVFFAPNTLLIFGVAVTAWRRSERHDERLIVGMLVFRWAFGFFAYSISPHLGIFTAAIWAECTGSALISFVVIGTAVLRSELFSVRSSAAEAMAVATMAFVVILGGGASVWAIQSHVAPGTLHDAMLFGATMVPLGLAGLGWAMYPRVERGVLGALDDRRARRLAVQGDPLPTDTAAALAEARTRIAAISDGATVKWVLALALPEPLAQALRDGEPRKRPDDGELPADFVVPAIGADHTVIGAFTLDGGLIDRDTYLVARELAARVALIVERHQAIAALDDARRLAALGQFAAAIAHDIRTPLTSISLNVQILRRKLELSADDQEHLDIAIEELGRLDRSVAEILDFAKPVRLATEAIDVDDLLETAARNLTPVLAEKHIALATGARSTPALAVQGDPQRLRQVLVNLVDNAADASQPGARVTLRATPAEHDRIAIEVEDHGRGIGPDELPRIFDPFFTTRPDGTGLGLTICRKIIRAHGGELEVRATAGGGSTFTVLLPAA